MTTLNYKTTMSNIAKNIADINAQKVQLNQTQQQLDMAWSSFEEQIRQYEKDFAEGQRQFNLGYDLDKQQLDINRQQLDINRQTASAARDSSIYERLTDMLSRYNTVTPEMAQLGSQVGMSLQVGAPTVNYLSEAERASANKAAAENKQYYNTAQMEQLANSLLPTVQASGKIGNSSQFASLLAQWVTEGVSGNEAKEMISRGKYGTGDNEVDITSIVGKSWGAKETAIDLAYRVLGTQDYRSYLTNPWSSSLNMYYRYKAFLEGNNLYGNNLYNY